MAPAQTDHDAIEGQLQNVIQDLYAIMVQTNGYDTNLPNHPSKVTLEREINRLSASLRTIHATSTTPNSLPDIPPELIQYVDNGRNPDIYTREFVELARKDNQMMKGKMEAFVSFRDVLAQEMEKVMPELKEDVERVLDETGGKTERKEDGSANP